MKKAKVLITIILLGIVIFIAGCSRKIDKQTSSQSEMEQIISEVGLDFDDVVGGANCYSGVQTKHFDTKKYGRVTVEFSYCKTHSSMYFRIYN